MTLVCKTRVDLVYFAYVYTYLHDCVHTPHEAIELYKIAILVKKNCVQSEAGAGFSLVSNRVCLPGIPLARIRPNPSARPNPAEPARPPESGRIRIWTSAQIRPNSEMNQLHQK